MVSLALFLHSLFEEKALEPLKTLIYFLKISQKKMKVLQSTFNFLPGRSKQIAFSCLLDQIFLLLYCANPFFTLESYYILSMLFSQCFPVVLFRTLLYLSQTEN